MFETTQTWSQPGRQLSSDGQVIPEADDFERFLEHDVLRSLICQLHEISRSIRDISAKERSEVELSPVEIEQRISNRILARTIEKQIKRFTDDFTCA